MTLVTTVTALTVVTLTLGTGTGLRLRAAPLPSANDVAAFFGLSLVLAPLAGVVTAAATVTVRHADVTGVAVLLAATFGGVSLLARQSSDLVQAYGRTSASIVSVAVGSGVQALCFIALVVLQRTSLSAALVCAIAGALAQVLFGLTSLRSNGAATFGASRLSPHVWRLLVMRGYPTIAYGLGLLAMQRLDRLLLVALAGPAAGGIYAVAATIAEAARITSSAVGQLLFVRTAEHGFVTAEVRRIYQIALILQLVILGVLAVAAPSIVHLLFGSAYADAVGFLRWLLVAEFFMGTALMDSRIIMGLGRLHEVGVITIIVVATAALLYVPLIKQFAGTGAVLGSILCYTAYSVILFCRRTLARRTTHGEVSV